MRIEVSAEFRLNIAKFISQVLAPDSLARGLMTVHRPTNNDWDKAGDLERARSNSAKAAIRFHDSAHRLAQ